MNNLSDPLFRFSFETKAAASLLRLPYIQRNLRQLWDHATDLSGNESFLIICIKHAPRSKSRETTVSIYNWYPTSLPSVEDLLALCAPGDVSITHKCYHGIYTKTLPGVTLHLELTAPHEQGDMKTLTLLGHVHEELQPSRITTSVVCEGAAQ